VRREEVKKMTFSEWMEFARANWRREEGQTMAEYGVVLAVITIGAVAVFTALSGGISGAINRVIGFLPK
jgi:Flp pilus assembly pilin Flp